MNQYLSNIFEQPLELKHVLDTLIDDEYSSVMAVAEKLNEYENITLTSMGSALNSLMPMYYALLARHKSVLLIESSELLDSPGLIRPNSLYIIMSRSGESYEVAKLPELLNEKGVVSIGISMTPESTMAKGVSILLYDHSSYDALLCTKAYTSMALCGMVCVHAMDKIPDKNALKPIYDFFDWLEENKETILKAVAEIPFPNSPLSFYLLSRSYGMGVVRSASLWLEEGAKICANVSSIDTFYHGPIELCRTQCIFVYLDARSNERSKMIWDKICSYSGNTIYFGPDESNAAYNVTTPQFDLDEGYIMLMLAMYFQLLTYHCALAGGIEPGEMENVSWVIE